MSKVKLSSSVGNAVKIIQEELGEEMLGSFELLLSHYKKSHKYTGALQAAIDTLVNFVKESNENRKDYYRAILDGFEITYELQIGDYVKCENLGKHYIGEVKSDGRIKWSDGMRTDLEYAQILLNECSIRLATEKEIEEYKQSLQWEEIGRLVDEYKVGDIVLYEDKAGIINGVLNDLVSIKESMYAHKIKNISLICPVEARIN